MLQLGSAVGTEQNWSARVASSGYLVVLNSVRDHECRRFPPDEGDKL